MISNARVSSKSSPLIKDYLISQKNFFPSITDKMFSYSYKILPLSERDEERIDAFINIGALANENSNIADLYSILFSKDKTKSLNRESKKRALKAIEIFKSFIEKAKEAYPNLESTALMDVAFIQKLHYISTHFKEISDYILSEIENEDKFLICAQSKPFYSKKGRFHLTENDIRTMKTMADYALIDELIDKDYSSSIGRLIVYK